MDCSVIYYAARKTSFCEKTLKRCFSPLHWRISTAGFANGAQDLGERLIAAFDSGEICVVVGGLNFSDDRSAVRIISHAAVNSQPDLVRRQLCRGGCGYLLCAGGQLLLLLPDEPAQIEEIMCGNISKFIRNAIR